jgi:hypothetical protein
MTMHAATLEILTRKGRFAADQAVAMAEAIDVAINEAQFVTVPILDARLSELKGEVSVLRGEFAGLRGEFAGLRGEVGVFKADLERKMDRLLYTLLIVFVGSNVALGPAGSALFAAIRRLF